MENPDTLSHFNDLMTNDLGGRDELIKGRWLHYQPTEVNTSIRDGWFYRDDTHQMTRSADDVFDMYERSTGGNAIFLLNIPPDKNGRFAAEDVKVLRETGRRIRETYGNDLLKGAEADKELLDNDIDTFIPLNEGDSIVVKLPERRTINRIALSEAIRTIGERVEEFAVDAIVNGEWTEIATSTNIGHKRILRFDDVETDGIRIRLTKTRETAAISRISAYYSKYKPFDAIAFHSPEMIEFDRGSWKTAGNVNEMDLGKNIWLNGIAYTPGTDEYGKSPVGTVSGKISTSLNGTDWAEVGTFDFGNLINDPTTRYYNLHNGVQCRYIRIDSKQRMDAIDIF